jgi:hypothetical protein
MVTLTLLTTGSISSPGGSGISIVLSLTPWPELSEL